VLEGTVVVIRMHTVLNILMVMALLTAEVHPASLEQTRTILLHLSSLERRPISPVRLDLSFRELPPMEVEVTITAKGAQSRDERLNF
jgi:hypothetical protein